MKAAHFLLPSLLCTALIAPAATLGTAPRPWLAHAAWFLFGWSAALVASALVLVRAERSSEDYR